MLVGSQKSRYLGSGLPNVKDTPGRRQCRRSRRYSEWLVTDQPGALQTISHAKHLASRGAHDESAATLCAKRGADLGASHH